MQTFLTRPNFESVKDLDDKRLGKQRVEALQIYQALLNGSRWRNHPAVIMWEGYEDALAIYHNHCVQEWILRGKNNTMPMLPVKMKKKRKGRPYPWWFGVQVFHDTHKSNLLRKDYLYYSKKGFDLDVDDNWLYLWPLPNELAFRVAFPKWAKDEAYYIPIQESPYPIYYEGRRITTQRLH